MRKAAQPVFVHVAAGQMWAVDSRPRVVFGFTITDGRIVGIEMISDPETLRGLDLEILSS